MFPSNQARTRADWRAWLALAWALWFGGRYALAVAEARGPGALAAARRLVDRGESSRPR